MQKSWKEKIVYRLAAVLFILLRLFAAQDKKQKRYLIFKQDGLGDLILWHPYCLKLKEFIHEQGGEMVLVTAPYTLELARFWNLGDRIIPIPVYRNSLSWLLDRIIFWWKCGTSNYELIAQAGVNSALVAKDLLPPLKSRRKITMLGDNNRFTGVEQIFTELIEITNEDIHRRYVLFLKAVTGRQYSPLSPECRSAFAGTASPEKGRYAVICIGASQKKRCWPLDKWKILLEQLGSIYSAKFIVIGSSDESFLAEELQMNVKNVKIENCCGKFTFPELFALMRDAEFVISNDTGPAHVAASQSSLCFILCGGGDYGGFLPYPKQYGEGINIFSLFPEQKSCFSCHWQNPCCLAQKVFPCVEQLSEEKVFGVIQKILQQKGISISS